MSTDSEEAFDDKEDNAEDEVPPVKPDKKLTEQEELMASRLVSLHYTNGNLEYRRTLVETVAEAVEQAGYDDIMMGLHVTICKQLVDEYHRNGNLSKNSHRRLTQVVHMYRGDIATKLKLDVEAAVEQAHVLDRYSEILSKNYRASRTEGNVSVVDAFPDTIEKRRQSLRSKES